MNQKLADFMVALAIDTAFAQRFHEDPAATMTAAGFSDAEAAAVLSGDSDRVRTALGRSYADHLTQQSNRSATRGSRRKGAGRTKKKAAATKTKTKRKSGKNP